MDRAGHQAPPPHPPRSPGRRILGAGARLPKQNAALVSLEDAVTDRHVAAVDVKPETRPAVMPEHAVPENAAIGLGQLHPTGIPSPVNGFPAVVFP